MASWPQQESLHDFRLLEFSVRKRGAKETDEVRMLVRDDERIPPGPPVAFEITFRRVRGLRLTIDFLVKKACHDSIASAGEISISKYPELPDLLDDWYRSISPAVPDRSKLHLYTFALTPQSGRIEILAEEVDFLERTADLSPHS